MISETEVSNLLELCQESIHEPTQAQVVA